jgi:glycosyltransferase involved in cell wall biosynthesis
MAYGLALSFQRRLRLIERWVDAIIVPSEHLAATLERAGFPEDRIHVIRLAVHVNGWHPRKREYALYAGRLSQEKGIDDLLEAARLSRVPLRIAGDGPLSDRVRRAADMGEVEYVGRLAPAELSELRQRAAFVVVPSVFPEISPFAALEAFADGTPVIASTTGGLPEIVDDPQLGTTVPPQDPAALAEAMSEWWDRRNEPDLGRAGWERASERYDLTRQTQSVLRLYESVLGSS